MSDLTPEHFDQLMERTAHTNLAAFVEVKTPNYRAVATNFFQLPIGLLLALKQANLQQDGSDLLILFDAVEIAFTPEDVERILDLPTSQFLTMISAWLAASAPQ
jgi:hypothetical protein